MKAEKDLDKQFKREFSTFVGDYEQLSQIFRGNLSDASLEKTETTFTQPESMDDESWARFGRVVAEKRGFEATIRESAAQLVDLQNAVTVVLDMSERLRVHYERAVELMKIIQEQRFRCSFDTFHLYQLTRGQVSMEHFNEKKVYDV